MFSFRFETLLNARRSAEEIFQKELAEAQRALADEQAALRASHGQRRRRLQELHRIRQQGFHASEVQLYERYLERLEREIDRQKRRVANAERRMNQKRSALIDAVKRRKALETLKTKDLQVHLNTLMLNERKFMDDVAIFSKSFTRGGGFGEK